MIASIEPSGYDTGYELLSPFRRWHGCAVHRMFSYQAECFAISSPMTFIVISSPSCGRESITLLRPWKDRSRARAVANARFDPSASGFAGRLQRSLPSTSQTAGCRLSRVRRLRATTNGESNMKEKRLLRDTDGEAVCHACKLGLEGIVSKRLGSFWALARLGYREWLSEIYGV